MDFELKHLEMISTESFSAESDSTFKSSKSPTAKTSSIIDDLSQQIEDLQNKIKISYKKQLLYETENQKLIQEKNTLYFENKGLAEKNLLVAEKNKKLAQYSHDLETENGQLEAKIEVAEKLIATQKIDLTRLSKFHLKIKNIIKPYVEKIKQENLKLHQDLETEKKLNYNHQNLIEELQNKIQKLTQNFEFFERKTADEKKAIVQSYEEQIHFLSKEIVHEQQKVLDLQNENLRLKKQNENKNFVENELIRFKRLQDEHLQTINLLQLKEVENKRKLTQFEVDLNQKQNQSLQLEQKFEIQTHLLDTTRQQLSLKLDEIEKLNLRLKMLEKLNSSLSLSLKDSEFQ